MFDKLPTSALDALTWEFEQYQPYYDDLKDRALNADTVDQWLKDWSRLSSLVHEVSSRLTVAVNLDTTNQEAEQRFTHFIEDISPKLQVVNHILNQKLSASGLEPVGFDIPLRKIRTEIDLFREENLPLITEENLLSLEYDKIAGAQTVNWQGEELTLSQLQLKFQEQDRSVRERAWRLSMERRLRDREALNDLWVKFMGLRGKIAANADQPDYRAYKWGKLKRFDYTPEDSYTFHDAIEKVVVPAAARLYQKRQERLKLSSLRPWDTDVDALQHPPLRPYQTIDELEGKAETIFHQVDPVLGDYFHAMRAEQLLDLDNRKGKAPGGYCTEYPLIQRPFIFMNAVGIHDDVQTLLHEGGHAFHYFESAKLPYYQQLDAPMEFCEVASMAMELLGAPYLTTQAGGYYTEAEAARARIEHMEQIVYFWPYMAVVDAFQHWVYTNHQAATNPANCDAKWAELWNRFMVGIDYSDLQAEKETGWHRKLHIFQVPFYYIEYGLAQLGAVQVWASALQDQQQAVANYRKALALGGTASLPTLFETAGANFAFDVPTLTKAVDLLESTINQLDHA